RERLRATGRRPARAHRRGAPARHRHQCAQPCRLRGGARAAGPAGLAAHHVGAAGAGRALGDAAGRGMAGDHREHGAAAGGAGALRATRHRRRGSRRVRPRRARRGAVREGRPQRRGRRVPRDAGHDRRAADGLRSVGAAAARSPHLGGRDARDPHRPCHRRVGPRGAAPPGRRRARSRRPRRQRDPPPRGACAHGIGSGDGGAGRADQEPRRARRSPAVAPVYPQAGGLRQGPLGGPDSALRTIDGGDMTRTSTFELPARLGHKAAAERIAADDAHFARIEETLTADIARVEQQLSHALARQTGDAQGRVEREATVDHFRRRLRGLRGYRRDAVLGRMSPADGGAPLYIGRLAVHAPDGTSLLVDWRSPAAAPFFAATRADPKGLLSRRRYRWADGRIRDYWDESLGAGARRADESPDEESALLASLERARTPQMAEVLTTLAADQDAIIRADPRGPLVVAGGPGTGKTVVALHRAAYLLYTDPRLRTGGDGVLVVGPHHPYLHYVADVLPSLGEDGVRTCTL